MKWSPSFYSLHSVSLLSVQRLLCPPEPEASVHTWPQPCCQCTLYLPPLSVCPMWSCVTHALTHPWHCGKLPHTWHLVISLKGCLSIYSFNWDVKNKQEEGTMNKLELINVCTQPFIAEAVSSCIEADGHSIHNLYSLDPAIARKGFQVERFIRPPLHLTFHFKVPVKVAWVVVYPELGEGEKCKIQVSVGPATGISTSLALKHCGQFVLESSQSPLVLQHRQCPGSEMPGTVLGSQLLPKLNQHQLSKHCTRSFSCVPHSKSLVVSLLHWAGHKVASLANVEVWGSVSPSASSNQLSLYETCKQDLQKAAAMEHGQQLTSPLLYNKMSGASSSSSCSGRDHLGTAWVTTNELHAEVNKHPGCNSLAHVVTSACHRVDPTHQGCYPKQLGSSSAATTARTSKSDSLDHHHHSIPAHFLDELTFEIMSVPMLLPSGHMVDRCTLDKTQEADLMFGRPPTDPFTGVPFSSAHQPRFRPHIKAQIDQFLSDHEAVGEGHGRTVGSAVEISAHLRHSRHTTADTIDQRNTDSASCKVSSESSPKPENHGENEDNVSIGIPYNCGVVLI